MTTNDDRTKCHRISCYGIVKEYKFDGVRDPPPQVKSEYNKKTEKLKRWFTKLLGKEHEPITWHECSVCHEYHPGLSD